MKIIAIMPKFFDFMAFSIVDGLNKLGFDLLSNESSNGLAAERPEVINHAVKNGLPVLVFLSNSSIIPFAIKNTNSKLILIDGMDHSDFAAYNRFSTEYRQPTYFFKRELLRHDRWLYPAVRPINFSISTYDETRFKRVTDKVHILSFLSNSRTNPLRGSCESILRSFQDQAVITGNSGECSYEQFMPKALPLPTPKYDTLLLQSLASISMPGAGYDCQRYWEIPAARSLLVTWEHDLLIDHDFIGDLECFRFSAVSDLVAIYQRIKSDPHGVVEIINRGIDKAARYHTSQRRAELLVDQCGL